MSKFNLLWDSYPKYISKGLSSLQQNGEFVDMTLAADGHMVKVHQIIIALASPYFKELINSAPCPHPVIFLNSISYTTLVSLLEYIYTGEVVVATSDLNDLMVACKNLHIRGLEDIILEDTKLPEPSIMEDNNTSLFEQNTENIEVLDVLSEPIIIETHETPQAMEELPQSNCPTIYIQNDTNKPKKLSTASSSIRKAGPLQFTISNQGSLQIILNRYLYYLKHSHKISKLKQWRCVDYVTSRCPAYVMTDGEVVVKRILAHTHTYHDNKILKKMQRNIVFHAYSEAEKRVFEKKNKKKDPLMIEESTCEEE